MAERLVDVKDGEGKVIHTYPITLPPSEDADAKFRGGRRHLGSHGQMGRGTPRVLMPARD
jgi:hypothetical protein